MEYTMSYVKYENTYKALQELREDGFWEGEDSELSESEVKYKQLLIKLCREIGELEKTK
jgi:hypothetical protein